MCIYTIYKICDKRSYNSKQQRKISEITLIKVSLLSSLLCRDCPRQLHKNSRSVPAFYNSEFSQLMITQQLSTLNISEYHVISILLRVYLCPSSLSHLTSVVNVTLEDQHICPCVRHTLSLMAAVFCTISLKNHIYYSFMAQQYRLSSIYVLLYQIFAFTVLQV